MKAGGCLPLAGIVTVWKPLNFHFTLSPTWTVIVLRKKALLSAPGGRPVTFCGGPATTVRVAAALRCRDEHGDPDGHRCDLS